MPLLWDLPFEAQAQSAFQKGCITCISYFVFSSFLLPHLSLVKNPRLLWWERQERRGIFWPCLLIAHTASPGCNESYSLLPATFPLPPPSFLFPPDSIPVSVQVVHACGEHIKTICEAAWQLDKCKHGLEVFI